MFFVNPPFFNVEENLQGLCPSLGSCGIFMNCANLTFIEVKFRFFSEGRRWIMKRHFQGMPTLEDFEIKSEPLQKLKDNEILLQPEFWSVDPYARIYPISFGYKLPMTMLG